MKPVNDLAPSVVSQVLRRQPLSPGKVGLAWQIAAGPKLARAAQITIAQHSSASLSLTVRARDARWVVEIDRLRPALIERLTFLLGKRVSMSVTGG